MSEYVRTHLEPTEALLPHRAFKVVSADG